MGATGAMGAMGMATQAIGTGMSAYGKMKAGSEAHKLGELNAGIAEWQAEDALRRGRIAEKRMRQETEKTIGSQRVALANQGVDINKGSALDVVADAAYLGELDALTIRNNAAKEAWGYKVQAASSRYQGQVAQQTGMFGAFETIIGSGSSMLLAKYGGGYRGGRTSSVPLEFNPVTAGK